MRNGNINYHLNGIANLFVGPLVARHSFCEQDPAEKYGERVPQALGLYGAEADQENVRSHPNAFAPTSNTYPCAMQRENIQLPDQ